MKFTFSKDINSEIAYKMTGIYKSYMDNLVLSDINLNMPKNGILVISGPSGEGKTTLLRIMSGLLRPDSGTLEGFNNKRITYMFQEDRLLPWFDLITNIEIVLGDINKTEYAKDWLEKVGLENASNKKPNELSGGMQRRAAFARTFAHDGDLIILDEPYKGLDFELKQKIIDITKQESKNKMLVVVTHDAQETEKLIT